ncbi:Dyp-type peroxidase [Microbacterium tumbae]
MAEGPVRDTAPGGTTRRALLLGAGAAVATGVAGWALRGAASDPPGASSTPPPAADVEADDRRAGITAPAVPQRRLLLRVLTIGGIEASSLPARVRSAIDGLPAAPADAGELTVTVGYAPAHARALWPDRASAASDLPAFAGDDAGIVTGGDLVVQVCAETASAVRDAADAVVASLGAAVLWEQGGYRDAPSSRGTARTSTGFIDGIMNPRTKEQLEAGVWADTRHRDTHLVVRRMRIDAEFLSRPVGDQEQAIGRERGSGAPLSGGTAEDEVDLFAKTADGRLLTPKASHARRAHPGNVGRPLMLRRSYSFDPQEGAGLLFIAFLSDPGTFVMTQRRLDEMDELIAHTATDASGCFFVPGDAP